MIPKSMGFVRTSDKTRADSLDFKSFYIRKEQATSIAAGLQQSRFIKNVKLRNCGLTDDVFLTIIEKLDHYSLKQLDISYNPNLTNKSYEALANIILDKRCDLTHLDVEGNQMGDKNLFIITSALQEVK